MSFLDKIKSAWQWIKSAIQKAWARFKVFLVKVANFGRTILGAVRNLVQKAMLGIAYLKEKFKAGIKKLFLIFTKKNTSGDSFKDTIKKAQKEGKIGEEDINGRDIFETAQEAEYDIHIVQTDSEFNTENVYSVSADKLSDELKAKATAHEVSEINITGI